MTYGELREQFLELLNRNDCDTALADRFIEMGLRRIERLLRTPLQRFQQDTVVGVGGMTEFPVPTDYLAMHYLKVDDVMVPRITPNQFDDFSGWFIEDASFRFSYEVPEGAAVSLVYYNEFLFPAVADGDITEYTLVLPDIMIYSAMFFACTHFMDDRKSGFEGDLSVLIQELQMMVNLDEWTGTGLQVTPQGGGIV